APEVVSLRADRDRDMHVLKGIGAEIVETDGARVPSAGGRIVRFAGEDDVRRALPWIGLGLQPGQMMGVVVARVDLELARVRGAQLQASEDDRRRLHECSKLAGPGVDHDDERTAVNSECSETYRVAL